MITPNQIREKTLNTVQSGGYDKDEVNELLCDVIDSYSAVYEENKELYRKMEILASKIEEYRSEEDSIKTALINAQKLADRITKEAKESAETKLSETAASAQQTVMDAKEKADKMIGEARSYAASFTKEKQEAAESIIDEAQQKANDAIDGAKVVAQNILNQAKQLSDDLVSKAKTEKEFHQEIVSKLKTESDGFKESLLSLYETQIDRLKQVVNFEPEIDTDDEKIQTVENEMNQIISNIDEINKLQSEPADAEKEIQQAAEEKAPEQKINVDEIIDEIETEKNETEEVPVSDVNTAIDAFSADQITPIDDNSPYISEISEEPEMEEASDTDEKMPFESYFNVNKAEARTEETISLIPPDDFDDGDDEEDSSKFKGFFKKKK